MACLGLHKALSLIPSTAAKKKRMRKDKVVHICAWTPLYITHTYTHFPITLQPYRVERTWSLELSRLSPHQPVPLLALWLWALSLASPTLSCTCLMDVLNLLCSENPMNLQVVCLINCEVWVGPVQTGQSVLHSISPFANCFPFHVPLPLTPPPAPVCAAALGWVKICLFQSQSEAPYVGICLLQVTWVPALQLPGG
jgi:hypothetical protein